MDEVQKPSDSECVKRPALRRRIKFNYVCANIET
jgi:hypothetical protein